MKTVTGPIAFQGALGANSDMACRAVFPGIPTLPCIAFEDVFAAVREGRAERAMIPVENSQNGRVADIHHLLLGGGLKIVGEYFLPVHHCLLGVRGAKLSGIREALSHVQALGQVRGNLRALGITPVTYFDTAGAAQEVAASRRSQQGGRRLVAGGGDLRARYPQDQFRGCAEQHDPLPDHVDRRGIAAGRLPGRGHRLRLRGPQYPGGAL